MRWRLGRRSFQGRGASPAWRGPGSLRQLRAPGGVASASGSGLRGGVRRAPRPPSISCIRDRLLAGNGAGAPSGACMGLNASKEPAGRSRDLLEHLPVQPARRVFRLRLVAPERAKGACWKRCRSPFGRLHGTKCVQGACWPFSRSSRAPACPARSAGFPPSTRSA